MKTKNNILNKIILTSLLLISLLINATFIYMMIMFFTSKNLILFLVAVFSLALIIPYTIFNVLLIKDYINYLNYKIKNSNLFNVFTVILTLFNSVILIDGITNKNISIILLSSFVTIVVVCQLLLMYRCYKNNKTKNI